ncbi:MAG: hypothetical protein HZB41_01935 [Ignavibacteriae bacterium]|nr:hypothetical protein [Ignavibacteriota bacterium]
MNIKFMSRHRIFISCIIVFIIFITIINTSISNDNSYNLIKIYLDSAFTYDDLLKSGLDLETVKIHLNSAEIIVNNSELDIIKSKNIKFDLLYDKYEKLIEKQIYKSKTNNQELLSVKNFKLGTMGGSYKLKEVYEVFDSIREKYPQYIANPEVIGYTAQDRPIMAYCISSNRPGDKKEVLITALHHAREGAGLTTLTYFLWHLLESAETGNTEALYLLNSTKLYVIPVVNPDGVAFNESIATNGGGLWRKNRKQINKHLSLSWKQGQSETSVRNIYLKLPAITILSAHKLFSHGVL